MMVSIVRRLFITFLIVNFIDLCKSFPWKPPQKASNNILIKNPIFENLNNIYSFFYWLPRRNIPYDSPVRALRNDTGQFLAWYQFPHNLPPYRYIWNDVPSELFCFGLPGNTLPLGNWDPLFLSEVTPKVVRKYRESEIKHGRLAMLGCTGIMVQEEFHPIFRDVGGLAVTHLDQLATLAHDSSIPKDILKYLPFELDHVYGLEYVGVLLILMSIEIFAFTRNWERWKRDEYNSQFDCNIGIGNLKHSYENGNYGFDPFKLFPTDKSERVDMIEKELNHGRLAMVAFVGILYQEYVVGKPALLPVYEYVENLFK